MLTTTIKRGDTPTLRWLFSDRGKPTDLTGATAVMNMRIGTGPVTSIPVTVVTPGTLGMVEHTFDGTLAAGPYDYEIEVTRNGVILTGPTHGTARLLVQADIRAE